MVKQVWGLNPNWFLHFNMTWSSGQLELNTSNCTTVNVKYSISHVRNNDEAMASRHDQYWYFICVFIEHSLFLIKYQRQVSPIFTMTRITLQHRLTGLQLRLREILNQKKVWNFNELTNVLVKERKCLPLLTLKSWIIQHWFFYFQVRWYPLPTQKKFSLQIWMN